LVRPGLEGWTASSRLEDREFIAAIREKREPNGSLAKLLPCMRTLGKLEKMIDPDRKAYA